MIQKGNIVIRTQSIEEITRSVKIADFLRERLDVPLMRFNLNERKNIIVIDGNLDYASLAFHFVRINERLGIRVFCGGENNSCWLCDLQKYYPDRIGKALFYCCYTVYDTVEKNLKILSIPARQLVHVYNAVKDRPDIFLRGVGLSIVKKDKYEYFITLEYRDNRVARYNVKDKNPYDYFKYFAPFTEKELDQLGFDVSLVLREKYDFGNLKNSEEEDFIDIESSTEGILTDSALNEIIAESESEYEGFDEKIF